MLDLAYLLEALLRMRRSILRLSLLMCLFGIQTMIGFAQPAAAEDWVVLKSSGQVWIATSETKPVALSSASKLLPGDLVQTGPTGRVLLTRGDERILVAPNSVVSLPKYESKTGFTTILQQAGSIAVEAEKKDLQHFEVQTPYLAAVVKGTTFTVTVGNGVADVRVTSGQVQTINLGSGRSVLILPGQSARVSANSTDVVVAGQGAIMPIEQGEPRPSKLQPVSVPKAGLGAPPNLMGLRVRSVEVSKGVLPAGSVRISHPIGAVKLDVEKVTLGLARGHGSALAKGGFLPGKDAGAVGWNGSVTPAGSTPASVGSAVSANAGTGNGNAGANGLALGLNAAGNSNGNGNGNAYGHANGNNGKHLGWYK